MSKKVGILKRHGVEFLYKGGYTGPIIEGDELPNIVLFKTKKPKPKQSMVLLQSFAVLTHPSLVDWHQDGQCLFSLADLKKKIKICIIRKDEHLM